MESLNIQQSLTPVFKLLRLTFGIVPIVAGADKFTNLLTNWEHYMSPALIDALPFSPASFMMLVGIIEIIAGVLVLIKAELGGYVVAAWLTVIALTLLASLNYLDVTVRDLVMAMSAFSMAGIAHILGK